MTPGVRNGIGKMEAYLERKEPTPVEMVNVAEHPDVPNEGAKVETVGALEDLYGEPESSRMAPPTAEETDPGLWWVPEEVGRHP
jgi:hypothetical protein